MKRKVYIETSIFSYLGARPSRDLISAARQQITWQWWDHQRMLYDCAISTLVLDEAGRGDRDAAQKRLSLCEGLRLVPIDSSAVTLAETLLASGAVPKVAVDDALHLATAAVHRLDYVMTWNFRHLANADLMVRAREKIAAAGYNPPLVCTPEELIGARHGR